MRLSPLEDSKQIRIDEIASSSPTWR